MSYYFHDFSKITVAQKHAGFQLLSFSLIHRPHCIKYSRSIKMASQHHPVSYFNKDKTQSLSWELYYNFDSSSSAHVCLLPPSFLFSRGSFLQDFQLADLLLVTIQGLSAGQSCSFSDTSDSKEQLLWL